MRPAPRRLLTAASLISLVAVTGACSSDAEPEQSSGPTGPTGCDGKKAPSFGAKKQAYDSVAPVGEGDAVGVQASQPAKTKASSGAKGWSVAKVSVQARVLTNGIYAISPDSVMLIDPAGRQCTRPRTNAVPSPLAVGEIDEKDSASGNVSFLVPEDADLSKYTVMYADDPAAKKADAEWSSRGVAPTGGASTACAEGRRSPLSLKDTERTHYGDSDTVGSEGSQVRITAEKPQVKALKPSTKHPNDVDGLAVKIKVKALGSAAFIDRKLFEMFDGKGTVCRYGDLGTEGETLTTDLVPDGETRSYTLIFWAPKGSADQVKQLQLIYRTSTGTTRGAAGWYDPKEKSPYPSPTKKKSTAGKKPSSSSTSKASKASTKATP